MAKTTLGRQEFTYLVIRKIKRVTQFKQNKIMTMYGIKV
jgi:hypothetical protein